MVAHMLRPSPWGKRQGNFCEFLAVWGPVSKFLNKTGLFLWLKRGALTQKYVTLYPLQAGSLCCCCDAHLQLPSVNIRCCAWCLFLSLWWHTLAKARSIREEGLALTQSLSLLQWWHHSSRSCVTLYPQWMPLLLQGGSWGAQDDVTKWPSPGATNM